MIIKRPVITEKSMKEAERGRYTFSVASDATKGQVAREIEEVFGLHVVAVKTSRLAGKEKRIFTRKKVHRGKRSSLKKAVVYLKEGERIELFEKEKKEGKKG